MQNVLKRTIFAKIFGEILGMPSVKSLRFCPTGGGLRTLRTIPKLIGFFSLTPSLSKRGYLHTMWINGRGGYNSELAKGATYIQCGLMWEGVIIEN